MEDAQKKNNCMYGQKAAYKCFLFRPHDRQKLAVVYYRYPSSVDEYLSTIVLKYVLKYFLGT